jgi:SAM-dependent methyltransferase
MNSLFRWQQQWCYRFDRILPSEFSVSGGGDFTRNLIPAHLTNNLTIYDVGGGKNPAISADLKARYNLRIVGLDIDPQELMHAPEGCYDRVIVADICRYRGTTEADLVICRAVLEHVVDADQALAGLASIAKPGGYLLLFIPSRNAIFARLNMVLPERVKRRLMFTIPPEKERLHGFPARYDRCTPLDMKRLAGRHGLEVERQILYYKSKYFSFFLPLYVLWRTYQLGLKAMAGEQAAETFSLVLRKC